MKEIVLIYECNEWKERNSMVLIMVTTSKQKAMKEIKRQVKNNYMEYEGDLIKDLTEQGLIFVSGNLDYGYIEIVEDGKML